MNAQINCGIHMQGIIFSLKMEGNPDTYYNTDEPKDTMLSEISQSQKDKYCMIPLLSSPQSSQIQRQKTEWWQPGSGGEGNEQLLLNASRGSVWEDEDSSGSGWW